MNALERRACARFAALSLVCCACAVLSPSAQAWGDKGHQVVALVAWEHMSPKARDAITAMLANDPKPYPMRDGVMTNASFDRQATWADYYRDSQRGPGVTPDDIHSYYWHFADIEIHGGSLEQACYGFQPLPPGDLGSEGPDPDCAVNKIEQFALELSSPSASADEKRLAIKYLMHFVGDIHQPLHAADDVDHGGNGKNATVNGGSAQPLHHHWDVTFVDAVAARPGKPNPSPQEVVAALKKPTAQQVTQWQHDPSPRRWALESYALARRDAYGDLPVPSSTPSGKVYKLSKAYADQAKRDVATQLVKAGVRLAGVFNKALAPD
ncbi:S1/P1 nuclease [Piscinibacter terrae]|uniref:S1/P1 Nuclease n=1 Tax=Piscinibacter terrae TaxID=2496871 RepID=A0A3N7ISU0_9BURK|nr:S1/P1 nuclease [Albitalea terrae]RQP21912.1 hypothetical protein DZC73_26090 [Albitalea terrae]